MEKTKELKQTKQCEHCPWKCSTNPYEIPNGYDAEKHRNLKDTIADENQFGFGITKAMACHETHDSHCVGWLNNQLGVGNNVGLRIRMLQYKPFQLELSGRQHQNFYKTLPTAKHLRDFKKKQKLLSESK